MAVTKPVNFAQGKPLAEKNARESQKRARYAFITSAEGGHFNGSSEYQSSAEQENLA